MDQIAEVMGTSMLLCVSLGNEYEGDHLCHGKPATLSDE